MVSLKKVYDPFLHEKGEKKLEWKKNIPKEISTWEKPKKK